MKNNKLFLTILVIVLLFSHELVLASSSIFDVSNVEKGLLVVNESEYKGKLKVMVEKEGQKYYYNIKNKLEAIPLQLGSGEYTVYLLQNISGKQYKVLEKEKLEVNIKDNKLVYLQSTQPIQWNEKMEAIKLAKILTKEIEDKEEKINIIYEYIVNNIGYDKDKINNIDNDYIPNIDKVFEDKKGICYDYSSLFAAMLRSIDIPTKLVKGYKNDLDKYHAWNEVYLESKDEWIIIDTTYDAFMIESGTNYKMIKDNNEYSKVGEY